MAAHNTQFKQWVYVAGLVDLGYWGPAYTWTNNQKGRANIAERLDRGLVNIQWALQYPNSAVFHLPRFSSDHMPILMRTGQQKREENQDSNGKTGG